MTTPAPAPAQPAAPPAQPAAPAAQPATNNTPAQPIAPVQAPTTYFAATTGFFKLGVEYRSDDFMFDDSGVATTNFTKIRGISNVRLGWDGSHLRFITAYYNGDQGEGDITSGQHGNTDGAHAAGDPRIVADFRSDNGGDLADGEYFCGFTITRDDTVYHVVLYTNLGNVWDPMGLFIRPGSGAYKFVPFTGDPNRGKDIPRDKKPYIHFISSTGAELVYISGQTNGDKAVTALTFHFYGEMEPAMLTQPPLTIAPQ